MVRHHSESLEAVAFSTLGDDALEEVKSVFEAASEHALDKVWECQLRCAQVLMSQALTLPRNYVRFASLQVAFKSSAEHDEKEGRAMARKAA